ncbi:MAG: hypothetical protein KDA80_01345, partial [Planctomycetaceae bacterium]|nr:hypothetical protein [Planctomycetaceae bacterium]
MRRVFLPPQQFGCRNPSPVWRVSQVLVILVGLIMVGEAQEAGPIVPEGPRPFLHFEREPEYDLPELKFLHEKGVIPLWLKALKRTEDELTLRVAEALLVAWNMGFSEVNKDIGDDLLEAFQKTQDVTARIGLARVLIAMDVKNASDLFAAAVTPDSYSLCEVLEPALARWGHEPTIKRNLARLNDQNTLDVWKRLAIRVLGESSSTQA